MAGMPFSVDDSLGALSIGTTFSVLLMGVLAMQTVIYYMNFRQDSIALKAIVSLSVPRSIYHTQPSKRS